MLTRKIKSVTESQLGCYLGCVCKTWC